jgi:hypothetical protein
MNPRGDMGKPGPICDELMAKPFMSMGLQRISQVSAWTRPTSKVNKTHKTRSGFQLTSQLVRLPFS